MYCQLDAIVTASKQKFADKVAIDDNKRQLTYTQLDSAINQLAQYFLSMGLARGDRVAIYLPKQVETVISILAASRAGLVFVPVNPVLKPAQVAYILDDCNVKLLITSQQRAKLSTEALQGCSDLSHLLIIEQGLADDEAEMALQQHFWPEPATADIPAPPIQVIDQDLAAILYTSGSTGQPKGVCLSHRNLIAGAQSVSQYLHNNSEDKILAVLPLSFDYGLSQITTGLLIGATVVLMEYLFPHDVIRQVAQHQITGLAAVPPLWIQLAKLEWPEEARCLRYFTNSGGAMPKTTLNQLRQVLPSTLPYLMYGLTEAFRSTYLEPQYVNTHPDSIGKAIPNAEVLVLRPDGSECDIDEPGELVHRGVHVSLGYWNAPDKTARRFKPIGNNPDYLPELAVWSGDTVRRDKDGFLYFIGRQDDMIKCSGYRISPAELEESLYQMGGVVEVVAIGLPDEELGQAIMLLIKTDGDLTEQDVKRYCQQQLPNYMQPKAIEFVDQLPRNPNGKIDRKQLQNDYQKNHKVE
ncbi:acyl-CoA ligase (AMP-forming), exosortase A system-associated [Kangiella koreensis]|uniref:Acyl-CoA ligase (AMP-forming), exosortase system type 1 associated n=1 Tax=Kangiella koreensis (strain DSM 16069 / JCM 12317 / KCTC 12182 / SW-125) TaxID=523791 RepID=C7R6Q2_KANKD|nr:acyl-CoA ligase (AMP-forming), exosortase A system-associated [Kangiella koreensis]ACV25568.1 acyl-CoA ligase (AMP-forming), exosortase system type 1 associated [Kangiella koreensis DSM 16069]